MFCAVLKRKTLPSIEMTDNNHATHSRAFVYKNYTIICNENILSFCLLSTIQFMQKVWFPLNFSCFAGGNRGLPLKFIHLSFRDESSSATAAGTSSSKRGCIELGVCAYPSIFPFNVQMGIQLRNKNLD